MAPRSKLLDKLLAHFDEWRFVQITRCFFLASPEEKKLRLTTVMELSVMLAEIKQVSMVGTALGEQAIASVIDGDWQHASDFAGDLVFEGSKERALLWRPFVESLRGAVILARGLEQLERRETEASS